MNLAPCESEIRAAYDFLTATMHRLGRDRDGRPILPEPAMVDAAMKAAAGRCGAMVSASIKRAKRELIVQRLAASQLDITPTVARHSAERLIGRGLAMSALLTAFAVPGRTAARKSEITPADLADLEAEISTELAAFSDAIGEARERIAGQWRDSPQRMAVLADWASQRASKRS